MNYQAVLDGTFWRGAKEDYVEDRILVFQDPKKSQGDADDYDDAGGRTGGQQIWNSDVDTVVWISFFRSIVVCLSKYHFSSRLGLRYK